MFACKFLLNNLPRNMVSSLHHPHLLISVRKKSHCCLAWEKGLVIWFRRPDEVAINVFYSSLAYLLKNDWRLTWKRIGEVFPEGKIQGDLIYSASFGMIQTYLIDWTPFQMLAGKTDQWILPGPYCLCWASSKQSSPIGFVTYCCCPCRKELALTVLSAWSHLLFSKFILITAGWTREGLQNRNSW